MTRRVIEHEIKLEKSVKIIFAALAFGLLAHALLPAFSVKSAIADIAKGPLAVKLSGNVALGGNLGLGGKLGLGGAVKCNGCIPPARGRN